MKPALLTIALLAALGGCSHESCVSGHIEVSPDGKWIAYLLETRQVIPWGPEYIKTQQAVSICWSSAATPGKVTSTKIAEWGLEKDGYSLAAETHFSFSPDGKHVAILHPTGLMFINLATGDRQTAELENDEIVGSLAWLDDQTVGYVSYKESGPPQATKVERTIWRQRFDQATDKRSVVYRDAPIRYDIPKLLYAVDGWPQEFWSLDSRYVLLRGADSTGTACLLDVAAGDLQKLPGSRALKHAAWSCDSRQVLWYTYVGANGTQEAFLYNTAERDTVDLSDKFQQLFGTSDPHLELFWTPDNRFVVGANLQLGGYLLQPQPWEARLIGKKLQKPTHTVPPFLRSQPVPGFLVASFAPDEAIVDYSGNILKELGPGGMSGWTVLPGGQEAVTVSPPGDRVIVETLE